MRLKSEIWVKAYLRRCTVNGAMGVVARHGDDDAGAIFIRVIDRSRRAVVFGPAPAGMTDTDFERKFVAVAGSPFASETEADRYLGQEARFDSDLWVIDVEDGDGRHFLGDELQE
jgi:hypothetical protein